VARAAAEDLEKVEGVSSALAERIFAAFHKER
jgi:excinuclease UvrABC nuclease subunit